MYCFSLVCFFINVSFRAVVSAVWAFLSSRQSSALYFFTVLYLCWWIKCSFIVGRQCLPVPTCNTIGTRPKLMTYQLNLSNGSRLKNTPRAIKRGIIAMAVCLCVCPSQVAGSGPPPLNSLTFRPVVGQLSEVVPFLLLEQMCGMACQAMLGLRRPRRCRCSRTGWRHTCSAAQPLLRNCLTLIDNFLFLVIIVPPEQWSLQ